MWSARWVFLQIVFIQRNFHYTTAVWPSSAPSSVQLLGLFENASASTATLLSTHSRAMFKAAVVLAQRYSMTAGQQQIGWQTVQTDGNPISTLSGVCRRLSTSNIAGIVGPELSAETTIIGAFAETVGLPVISHASTDPRLSNRMSYPTFYRTVPSDSKTALAIAKLLIRFNWLSCILIYQNDAYGTSGADVLKTVFDGYSLQVRETLIFDIATLSIQGDLKNSLSQSSTRLVVVWAQSSYTSMIIQNALDQDVLGPHFVWIFTTSVSLDLFNSSSDAKLVGILAVEPAVGSPVGASVNTTLLNAAYDIWQQYERETFPETTNVDSYALLAFDATWSLIQSLPLFCSSMMNTSSPCLRVVNSTFCFDTRLLNSSSLLKVISNLEFLGVSGPIRYGVNSTDRINGTFFVIKNIQQTSSGIDYVPVLKWTDSAVWDMYQKTTVIIWPGNALTTPSGIPNLNGAKLRIGVIKSPPFLMVQDVVERVGQNSTQLIGFVPDLIKRLQSLSEFIPAMIPATPDQTYQGMVQAVADGTYDIVIGDITVTAERRKIVDFSTPIYDNTFSIIVRKTPIIELDFFSYLKPFSGALWLTLLGACIYSSILVWLMERQVNEFLKDRSILTSMAMSIWYSLGTVFGYGVDFALQTTAGRLLTLGLYILSLILLATYTANLASDLTILKSNSIISGIDDIKNGKIPFNRIGILANSSFEEYFLREISFGSRNFLHLRTQDEIYTNLLNHRIDASIMDTGLLQYATNKLYCNLTLVGAPFNPNTYAIVIPKQWIYSQPWMSTSYH